MYRTFYFKRWDICDSRKVYSKRVFKTEQYAKIYSKFIAVLMDLYTKGAEYGICYGVEKLNTESSICKECNGEGETYHYLVNHTLKTICQDWMYCRTCYPYSSGTFQRNYEEVSKDEIEKYLSEGYTWE